MSDTKKCSSCGTIVLAEDKFCSNCGSTDFEPYDLQLDAAQPEIGAQDAVPAVENDVLSADTAYAAPAAPVHENIAAGIVGAFLFALIGAALYFGLYQIGFIAGICGFVMFILANFGYGLFCGSKNSVSTARIITCIVITVIMIALAEYLCLSFELFNVFREEGEPISFTTALRMIPYVIGDKEVLGPVVLELLFAYGLSAVAIVSNVIRMVKDRKTRKAA